MKSTPKPEQGGCGRDLGIEGLVELEVLGLESKNLLAELGLNLNLLVLQEKKRKKGLIGS